MPSKLRDRHGHRALVAKLYHFGDELRSMGATFHELASGDYHFYLVANSTFESMATGGIRPGATVVQTGHLHVPLDRAPTTVAFDLPPRIEVHLGIFQSPEASGR